MHISLLTITLSFPLLPLAARLPKDVVRLSDVQTLTLRGGGAKTTHRRVPAIPQLRCVSPAAVCKLHDVDVMRCTNQGSSYGAEDVEWSCTATLPAELKLGSTEVICEGYSSPDDPLILKGSCAVEYRLVLTEKGEDKYPDIANGRSWFGDRREAGTDWSAWIFGVIFFAVVAWMLYSACYGNPDPRNPRRRRGGHGGGHGGGGGGGDGGGGWNPDWGTGNEPPPPYPGKKPSSSQQQQGWSPGFWSGLAGGAAAGYMAGNRGGNQRDPQRYGSGSSWGSPAGPSRQPSSSSSGTSSARHESTGFGSTSRR